MAQTRWMSILEAKVNLIIAFGISWAMNFYLLPVWFNLHPNASQSFWMVAIFTLTSFVRQYFVRRMFNLFEKRKETKT